MQDIRKRMLIVVIVFSMFNITLYGGFGDVYNSYKRKIKQNYNDYKRAARQTYNSYKQKAGQVGSYVGQHAKQVYEVSKKYGNYYGEKMVGFFNEYGEYTGKKVADFVNHYGTKAFENLQQVYYNYGPTMGNRIVDFYNKYGKETGERVLDLSLRVGKKSADEMMHLYNTYGPRVAQECFALYDKYGANADYYAENFVLGLQKYGDRYKKISCRIIEKYEPKVANAVLNLYNKYSPEVGENMEYLVDNCKDKYIPFVVNVAEKYGPPLAEKSYKMAMIYGKKTARKMLSEYSYFSTYIKDTASAIVAAAAVVIYEEEMSGKVNAGYNQLKEVISDKTEEALLRTENLEKSLSLPDNLNKYKQTSVRLAVVKPELLYEKIPFHMDNDKDVTFKEAVEKVNLLHPDEIENTLKQLKTLEKWRHKVRS